MSDDNIVSLREPRDVNTLIGAVTNYASCVVEGHDIPGLQVFRNDNGMVSFRVDRRFEIDVPDEYAHSVAWIIAQALAVGAGYPHFGAANKDRPFAPTVINAAPVGE